MKGLLAAFAVVVAVVAQGCATPRMVTFEQTIQNYIGQPTSAVVLAIGAPTRTYDDPAGIRILVYDRTHAIDGGPRYGRFLYNCELTFTADQGGAIREASFRSDYATCDQMYGQRLASQP